ncbi:MAG: 30S ribosomal protein S15 [Conexivisphaerales archaeon]
MARIHSHRHGKSHSSRPPSIISTQWINQNPEAIESTIVKLAKEGYPPSVIGVKLRDEYGVPLVKKLINKSITQVLREAKVEPSVPEDLQNLLNKARRLQAHLKVHKADRKNVHSLELLEAKIHRLSKYYKKNGVLPENWKYSSVVAQLA